MALLNAGARLNAGVNRNFSGVTTIAGAGFMALRGNFDVGGARYNFPYGWHAVSGQTIKSGVPNGYRNPFAWRLAQKGGAMTSRNECYVTVTPTGNGAMGLAKTGSCTITINASALGGLIAGGVGNATVSITADGDIVATISSPGNASFSVDGTADIGALGWLVGTGDFQITGDMVSYAIGHMEGTTEASGLTVAGIVNAVWRALAADYNDDFTMGNLLNNSGASANPWLTEIEDGVTASDALKLMLASLAGKISGADTNRVVIRNAVVDDKERIIASVDTHGNRTDITYDVS